MTTLHIQLSSPTSGDVEKFWEFEKKFSLGSIEKQRKMEFLGVRIEVICRE